MSNLSPQNFQEFASKTSRQIATLQRHGKPQTGAALIAARNRNPVINGNFRTNQRGVTSGVVLGPRQYGFDRWAGAGIINLLVNPSFETNLTGWSVESNSAITRVTSGGLFGACAMRLQFNSTSNGNGSTGLFYSSLVIGQRYTFSVWIKALSGSRRVMISTTLPDGSTFAPTASWTRIRHTFIASATSQYVGVFPAQDGTGTGAVGDAVLLDGFMLTQGDTFWAYHDGSSADSVWTGTAHASTSVRGPASTTLTWVADPHGQPITIASGGGLSQVIERANLDAGTWTVSHAGTAPIRVYSVGTDPSLLPAFATSPVTVALDGLDDVVIETRAIGGAKTQSKVQIERGSIASPFEEILLGQELSLCQRYFWRLTTGTQANQRRIAQGFQVATTIAEAFINLPVIMRRQPIVTYSGLWWTDGVGFNAGVTSVTYTGAAGLESPANNILSLYVTFPANGAAHWPGALACATAANAYLDMNAEM